MPPFARSRSLLLLLALAPACFGDPDDPPELGASEQEIIFERNLTVATGHQHGCAIAADATVQCWGRNNYGQLGNGTTADSVLPVTVPGITAAVAITAGKYHTCAAVADGTARCWGQGDSGQLGNGSLLNRTTPVVVSGLANVTSLSAGGAHTCATIGGGQARCWGSNAYGQLGTNTTTNASVPQTVMYRSTPTATPVALTPASEVETGNWSSCARLSTGVVACWGRNNAGQLGDGTTTATRLTATATSGVATAVDVAVGDQHACAALSNGRVRCWGSNLMGQLGDGTQVQRNTPVEMQRRLTPTLIYPIVSVTAAGAGQYHTCVRSAGEVWCAGRNHVGQLGMPVTPYLELLAKRTEPVALATEVAAGGEHTCVRRPDGGILCFGDDTYGQLGNYGRCPAFPTATVTDVAAPGGRLLERDAEPAPIHYVDGDRIEITLTTSGCAQVSSVDFRNLAIEGGDPIETQDGDITYEVTSNELADGTRQHVVTIDFDNLGDGTSYPLTVTVTSPAGNSASATIQVAEVLEAGPDHNGYIDVSEEELMNEVLQSMYEKFGDANYWRRSSDSFPDPVNLYDFEYANLYVGAGTNGIELVAYAKVDLNPWGDKGPCDPTAQILGRFRVMLDGATVTTVWDVGPTAYLDWPTECLGGDLNPLLAAIGDAVAGFKDDKVEVRINERLAELTERCDTPITNTCDELVQSVTHHADGIRITLNPLFESVTFRAPYRSSQFGEFSPGTPMQRGISVPGEPVLLLASGVVEGCGLESCPEVDRRFGPSGLFNWNWEPRTMLPAEEEPWGPHPPILDPWQCDPVYGCAHIVGRQGPWLRQNGLRRTVASLPMPSFNAGALVARTFRTDGTVASPMLFAGDFVCSLPAPETEEIHRLVVGRNDHTALGGAPLLGEFGRGEALVTLAFAGFGGGGLDCRTE